MLSGGNDQAYRRILATGGTFVRRLEAWKGGVRVDGYGDAGIPISDGSLSANLENRVTRRLRLTLSSTLFPAASGSLLDPLETELVLWCGWRGGAASAYLWPAFTGPVTAASLQVGSATCAIDAADRVEQIVEDKFTVPVSSGPGVLVSTRVKDLISDSQPGALFGTFDETYAAVPSQTWEADRAAALDDLAGAVGCFWYQLPDGRYTMRLIPWGQSELGPAVATITSGVDGASVTLTRSRTGVYTICQVAGEPATGDAPVSGTASDTDPESVTYYRGPLGRRVLKVQEDTVASSAQAEGIARQRLRRGRAQVMQVATSGPYDPSLELGDVATIITDQGSFPRALSSFTANVGRNPNMSIQWKSPGGDEE